MRRPKTETLLAVLTLTAIMLAVAVIVLHIGFWHLPLAFLALGAACAWRDSGKALRLFLFLLPLINSTPDLFFNGYPFNYMAPALFMLAGIVLVALAGKPEGGPRPPWLHGYMLFLAVLWISALFVFLRWSNLTLSLRAFLKDTPVSPAGDRLSFAVIFPVITLFLFTLAPWLPLLLRRSRISRQQGLRPLLAGYGLSLLLALMQRGFFPKFMALDWWAGIGQYNGGFSDFNGLGFFSGTLFLVVLLRWITALSGAGSPAASGRWSRAWSGWARWAILMAVTMAGIVISGSRSAFFFFLVGVVVFIASGKIAWRLRIVAAGVILLSLLVAGGTLARRMGAMGGQIGRLLSGSHFITTLDEISNGRVGMLQRWSHALAAHPLAGIGTGNFLFYYRFANHGAGVYEDLPLNQYLHVAVETGFIGLLVFVLFLSRLWRTRQRREERILLASILVILFVNTALWLPECILLFFFLTAGAEDAATPRRGPLRRPLLAAALLLAFAAACVASFSALHPARWAAQCRTGYDYGLYASESGADGPFRWSGTKAGLYLSPGEWESVTVRCAAPLGRLSGQAQSVRVYWNGRLIAGRRFRNNGDFAVPIHGRAGFLELRVAPPFSLRTLRRGGDRRRLGVQVLLPAARRP